MTASNNNPKDATLRAKGMEFARKNVQDMFAKSQIANHVSDFPKFALEEVQLGKVLGKGGFGTVSEVRAFDANNNNKAVVPKPRAHPSSTRGGGGGGGGSNMTKSVRNFLAHHQSATFHDDDDDDQVDVGQMESRKFIADHCIRNGGDARYALKILSPDVVADTAKLIQGCIDMAVETRFLSDIEHPNIIKMRATAQCDPYHAQYFIVMDRLYDTLEKRLATWGIRAKRHASGIGRLVAGGKKKAAALYQERIVAAFDLAAAVEYLHSRAILYRDLKPENVGFDIRGDIKIFDFGLAKELANLKPNENGLYKLTGMTGSPQYMAPEVALEKPYNATADSYSFSIMLWEIIAMRTPFELYTMKSLKAKVWEGGKRPGINDTWPVSMKLLLKRSWDEDPSKRNSMAQICAVLRKECVRCRGGDDEGLEHNRRRSTFVFRPKKQ